MPFKRYVAHWSDCKTCPWSNICVSQGSKKASRGRMLNRNIYEDFMDNNDHQVASRKNEYRKRQAIDEHPFGTIKRQWGYTHTLMKGLEKVNGEFAIIMLCYNLKRVMSILGINGLIEALNCLNERIVAIAYLIMSHTRFKLLHHKSSQAACHSFN